MEQPVLSASDPPELVTSSRGVIPWLRDFLEQLISALVIILPDPTRGKSGLGIELWICSLRAEAGGFKMYP